MKLWQYAGTYFENVDRKLYKLYFGQKLGHQTNLNVF